MAFDYSFRLLCLVDNGADFLKCSHRVRAFNNFDFLKVVRHMKVEIGFVRARLQLCLWH